MRRIGFELLHTGGAVDVHLIAGQQEFCLQHSGLDAAELLEIREDASEIRQRFPARRLRGEIPVQI
jgi:hypothetical protein